MRAAPWAVLLGVWSVLSLGTARAGELSPLNLSPGFPTSLDDAYPVNEDTVVFQPAMRFDKTRDRDYLRGRQTGDLRWGASKGMEVFVGSTTIRGPLQPGTMDDPRAVRLGLLYRFTRQSERDGLAPSLAIRTMVQVPFQGPQSNPALRTELLGSWELSNGWWGHANLGYQVVPGGQPGLQAPGRTSVWYGRTGFVKALLPDLGLIGSVTASQDYTQPTGYLFTPEVGLTYAVRPDLILMVGGGGDLGNSGQRASERGSIGVAWVW